MTVSIPSSTLEKFTTFGDLLRFLRRRMGITQIELATAVGYSDTQISRLEQNLRLPDMPTIEARFVSALGLEQEPNVMARLLDLAANVRREDAPGLGLCPYKGLNYFDEFDADLFVGREALTTKLTERVLSMTVSDAQNQPRFLAIVGASGSGKSSLVRAGLVSALRWNKTSTDWHIHVLTPTAHPLENLAAALTDSVSATATLMDDLGRDHRSLQIFTKRKLGSVNGAHLLLVIDQFEELFALCRSEAERASFITNLLTAASETDGPILVVMTLRADFYAPCSNYPRLREALARSQEYIGAMSNEELKRSIEEPARRGRWELEPGLVDLLLHDVGHEPGALPLLSHALFETWQRRRGRTMTLSGYTSSGGVRGAIAETAEAVFADQFTHEQQAIARRIFLRLTELGDDAGAGDTRRRATFDELILKPEEAATTHAVLNALADARLITKTEEAAEVAHEALIREWPTLHGWLEENREGLRLHRQLTETAQQWLEMQRESDMLYRGARLAQAREWASTHQHEMNEREHEFLHASIAFSEREAEAREAQRQRELAAAHKLAESERQRAVMESQRAEEQDHNARQLRKRALYLTGTVVIALVLAFTSLFFSAQSRQAALTAQEQERIALSREIASAAISNLEIDPERSILLALQAESEAHTLEAENALHRSILASRVRLVLHHNAEIWNVTFSPDGKKVATASQDKTAKIWDATTGQLLLTLRGHTESVNGIVYSPDGKRIATTSDDHTAKVWDADTGKKLLTLSGHTNMVLRLAFSPDGTRIVTTSADKTAKVWNAGTGKELLTFSGFGDIINDVAFSPDGKRVATTDQDGNVRVWDPTSGKELLTLPVEKGHYLNGVAFSPDGRRIAVAGDGINLAKVWDAETGELLLNIDFGDTSALLDIAFSPNEKLAATGGWDRKAKVWDTTTGQILYILSGHTSYVNGVAFSPDGTRLATASWDHTARVWDITPAKESLFIPVDPAINGSYGFHYTSDRIRVVTANPDENATKMWDGISRKELLTFSGQGVPTFRPTFSPDGKMMAGNSGTIILVWDTETGEELVRLAGHTDQIQSVAFSRDGTRLASGGRDNSVIIWDLSTGKALFTLAHDPTPQGIMSVAYNPDGTQLVSGDYSGNATIWDTSTGEKIFMLPVDNTIPGNNTILDVIFSPNGEHVATASYDGITKIWDTATGKEVLTLKGHGHGVVSLAFTPDGKKVVTASPDGTARFWDAITGVNLLTLPVHSVVSGPISFSPDGKQLAVGTESGVYIFILPIEDLVALAKQRVTRSLTTEECQQYLHVEQCPPTP
jgi:WD40 repeat protein/transcriptional regulator with XRE-family HTH domain